MEITASSPLSNLCCIQPVQSIRRQGRKGREETEAYKLHVDLNHGKLWCFLSLAAVRTDFCLRVYMCSLENLPSPTSHLYPTKTPLYLLGTDNFLLSYQASRGAPHIIYTQVPRHFLGLLDQNLMTSPFQLSHMDDVFCILETLVPERFWQHKSLPNQLHLLCSIIRTTSQSPPHALLFLRN